MYKRNILTSIGVSTIVGSFAFAAPALAQDDTDRKEGFYVSATGGADFLNDSDFVGIQDPDAGVAGVAGAPANVNVEYDSAFTLRGAVGYKFKKGLFFDFLKPRVELEVGYSEADVSGGSINGGDQTFRGDLSKLTVTAASYNDIIWAPDQKFIPYFGGGIGVGVIDADINYIPNNGVATAPTFGVQGKSTGFLTFSALGASYSATKNFDIFAEGRYTKIYKRNFDRRSFIPGAEGTNARVRDDTESFGFGIGARFKF